MSIQTTLPNNIMGYDEVIKKLPRNECSTQAYLSMDRLHNSRIYQKILGLLSDDIPRTREEIALTILGTDCTNTINGRINELITSGILSVQGLGTTKRGRQAEKIGITLK